MEGERKRCGLRLSLAYAQLEDMPEPILDKHAERIQFLDLSYNDFSDLTFLEHFSILHTLILDRNTNINQTTLPVMRQLKTLWLNNCNIIDVNGWLQKLRAQCPRLRHLSMMCNPVGDTTLNGVTEADERKYRKLVVEMLPQLRDFDGIVITDKERSDGVTLLEQQKNSVLARFNFLWKSTKYTRDISTRFEASDGVFAMRVGEQTIVMKEKFMNKSTLSAIKKSLNINE